MRTVVRSVSCPAEVQIAEEDGLYYYVVAVEDVILTDYAATLTEAAEETIRFLLFQKSMNRITDGVVRDIAWTVAMAVATESGRNAQAVYRRLMNV